MALKITLRAFLEVTLLLSFFGQVGENSGKNPSHPQTFACSYAYVLHRHSFKDFWSCICESPGHVADKRTTHKGSLIVAFEAR